MEKFLKKFPADTNYTKLEEAILQENKEEALVAAHTLKGVCGNLSMQKMFELMTEQVGLFRAGEWQQATDMMPEVRAAYHNIIDAIEEGQRNQPSFWVDDELGTWLEKIEQIRYSNEV